MSIPSATSADDRSKQSSSQVELFAAGKREWISNKLRPPKPTNRNSAVSSGKLILLIGLVFDV
jgi:hypothetical protein